MFHDGDLTSGITKAVQGNKLVVCFVRAEDDEASDLWENEWLSKPVDAESTTTFGQQLSTKAVILRLRYGTQEANFLNAFCQITEPPTLVVVHNGQVLEKVEGDVTKEEFIARIRKATKLGDETSWSWIPSTTSQAAAQTVQSSPAASSSSQQPVESSSAASSSSQQPQSQSQPGIQNLFPERAQQHAAEQSRRDAAQKAERAAAREKQLEEATAANPAAAAEARSRRDWLFQQKKRNEEAKREKERVLAQIEADKQNRKARTQAQRDARLPPSKSIDDPSQSTTPSSKPTSSPLHTASQVSLQIRLFDGSSIKSRFPPTATLAADVRQWISSTVSTTVQPTDTPYTFRQILSPAQPRAIGVSEEHQSLRALDLIPSATLVLVPVSGYADAYGGTAGGGYLGAAWNLASELLGSVAGIVPGLGGLAGPASTAPPPPSDAAAPSSPLGTAASARPKVKTLADQRAEEAAAETHARTGADHDEENRGETEFYNGNSLGFEGRPRDDDDGSHHRDDEAKGSTKRRTGKGKGRDD
jgi:chemotaxis protein histidine kinase CheA